MLYSSEASRTCQIIPFQMEILSRHTDYLSRWLDASTPMGICNADIFTTEEKQAGTSSAYVVIWVRETADPAYKIYSRGNRWIVMDAVRDNILGSFAGFADALNMIRPVLPREKGIVAA